MMEESRKVVTEGQTATDGELREAMKTIVRVFDLLGDSINSDEEIIDSIDREVTRYIENMTPATKELYLRASEEAREALKCPLERGGKRLMRHNISDWFNKWHNKLPRRAAEEFKQIVMSGGFQSPPQIVHLEESFGYRIEIFQEGGTLGTNEPRYFFSLYTPYRQDELDIIGSEFTDLPMILKTAREILEIAVSGDFERLAQQDVLIRKFAARKQAERAAQPTKKATGGKK